MDDNLKFDYQGATDYARELLVADLSEKNYYHNIYHVENVVEAVDMLAKKEDLDSESRFLVLTAAWYHDIGFIENQNGHEEIGAEIVEDELPEFGYKPDHIVTIANAILATKVTEENIQSPNTHADRILCDADLEILASELFWIKTFKLKLELEKKNDEDYTLHEYLRRTLDFMQQHKYYTGTAQRLFKPQKEEYMKEIIEFCDVE